MTFKYFNDCSTAEEGNEEKRWREEHSGVEAEFIALGILADE